MSLCCPYCDRPAVLVTGTRIYPHRPDLRHRWFWQCAPCDAWVGTHKDSRDHAPLGGLANRSLRNARKQAHAAFDPMWRDGTMKRREAYAWLAERLNVSPGNCHIAWMDVDACKAVVSIMGTVTS